jgi:alpha-1,6-mannosyltransferase
MAESAVVVAPSPFETFGLSVVEALASGTPVVVPHIGAGQELVAQGCGAVAPFSAAGFAVAINELLGWNRDEVRVRCRSHAQNYSWAKTGESLLELYADILGIQARSVA